MFRVSPHRRKFPNNPIFFQNHPYSEAVKKQFFSWIFSKRGVGRTKSKRCNFDYDKVVSKTFKPGPGLGQVMCGMFPSKYLWAQNNFFLHMMVLLSPPFIILQGSQLVCIINGRDQNYFQLQTILATFQNFDPT